MAAKKTFLLRVPPELWDALQRLADAELRSVNGQIELLLREGLDKRGIRVRQPSGAPSPEEPEE